jgi:hypothetical protein
MENPWKINGKFMGNPENHGKFMGNPEEMFEKSRSDARKLLEWGGRSWEDGKMNITKHWKIPRIHWEIKKNGMSPLKLVRNSMERLSEQKGKKSWQMVISPEKNMEKSYGKIQ